MRELPIEQNTSEIQSWHSLGGFEHICDLRRSCTVLYGIFTELARLVYGSTDGRLKGTPGVVWHPGGTAIWIDSELRWEDEHPEARPAIYVQLGQITRTAPFPGMNARATGADRFGTRHYETRASGTVTFLHVAQTVGEACALADNTEYALSLLQDPICRDFCFTTFETASRVPLQKAQKEAGDRFVSAVTFAYSFDEAWDVKEECPILKAIDMIESEENVESNSRQATVKRDNISAERTVSAATR